MRRVLQGLQSVCRKWLRMSSPSKGCNSKQNDDDYFLSFSSSSNPCLSTYLEYLYSFLHKQSCCNRVWRGNALNHEPNNNSLSFSWNIIYEPDVPFFESDVKQYQPNQPGTPEKHGIVHASQLLSLKLCH